MVPFKPLLRSEEETNKQYTNNTKKLLPVFCMVGCFSNCCDNSPLLFWSFQHGERSRGSSWQIKINPQRKKIDHLLNVEGALGISGEGGSMLSCVNWRFTYHGHCTSQSVLFLSFFFSGSSQQLPFKQTANQQHRNNTNKINGKHGLWMWGISLVSGRVGVSVVWRAVEPNEK